MPKPNASSKPAGEGLAESAKPLGTMGGNRGNFSTEVRDKLAELDALKGIFNRLPIDLVDPDPDQPRKEFDETQLESLASSIEQDGLLEPIVVRRKLERYIIIAGERRWRACKLLGLKLIDAVIREKTDISDLQYAQLAENLQREDLADWELEAAISALDEKIQNKAEIARRLGKSATWVKDRIAAHELRTTWYDLLRDLDLGSLSTRQLARIAPLPAYEIENALRELAGASQDAEPGAPEDEEPGAPKDAEAGAPQDEEPGASQDEEPGASQDEEPGASQDEELGASRDEEPGAPRDEEPGASRDAEPGAPKDKKPGAPKAGGGGATRGSVAPLSRGELVDRRKMAVATGEQMEFSVDIKVFYNIQTKAARAEFKVKGSIDHQSTLELKEFCDSFAASITDRANAPR